MLGQALYQGNKVIIVRDVIINQTMEVLITQGAPDDLRWVKLSDLDRVVWIVSKAA